MSYDIIYDLQFIRTSRGVTPVILAGPNNVTTGSGKHEHRVRSWRLWSSEMVDIPETDLIEIIQDSVANYDADYTLFKRGGKWVNPDGLIQMFRSACKKAARIEDIYAADRSGYLSCSVKYYEGHSMKAIDRINEIIKTTESFEAWIDAARREYETMKKQGKDVWLNVQFNSGEKPLKKASGAKGPVILREGKDRYVKDYTENSVEFTGNPEDAKVFNDAASAQNEIHPVLFSKMRIVSANVINRKRNMNIALRDNDGFYIAGLTARRLKYTRHFGDAKKFASVEAARAWFKKYQIAERFPVFADALPVDGEGIRKSSLCQDPVK